MIKTMYLVALCRDGQRSHLHMPDDLFAPYGEPVRVRTDEHDDCCDIPGCVPWTLYFMTLAPSSAEDIWDQYVKARPTHLGKRARKRPTNKD